MLRVATMTKTVICSHGFAMRADSAGLFTDIERAFPSYQFRMFDYYDIDTDGNQYVTTLDTQATRLQCEIDAAPAGKITLLCHSQGSTVASLVDISRVDSIILLAPPVDITADSVFARLAQRTHSTLTRSGMSAVPRRNGTVLYIPAEYFDSIEREDRLQLYQRMAHKKPLTVVRALDDEILGLTRVDELEDSTLYDIAADHNFRGESRQLLIDVVAREL